MNEHFDIPLNGSTHLVNMSQMLSPQRAYKQNSKYYKYEHTVKDMSDTDT